MWRPRRGDSAERLSWYWDTRGRGQADATARPPDLDPTLLETVEQLHAHDDAQLPDPRFLHRLEMTLMDTLPLSPPLPSLDASLTVGLNGQAVPVPRPPWLSVTPRTPERRQGLLAAVATAALVALVLVGSIVVFGPGRPVRQNDSLGAIPAVSGTPATPAITEAPVAEFVWQSEGDPALPLADPVRVALDPDGNIWVTDGRNSRFQIFAPDGTFLEAWGESGSGPGHFDFVDPSMFGGYGGGSMAFDATGNLYVLDSGNYRVQKFGPDRTFLAAWGSKGTGDGQFMAPTDRAIDDEGRVYVTDEGAGRDDVQVFDSDGQFLSTWGDTDQGWLPQPSGVTIDADGNLWIAHFNSNRVQHHAPDGTLLATVGEYGTGPGQFLSPNDVAVDEQGRLYVADWGGSQIQVFDAAGNFLALWGEFGSEEGQLNGPNIAVPDGLGNVYVAEDGNDRVQKFRVTLPLAP
jgi:DNA-binding beta-propeller fold protein YncE